jgi:methanesulfonate monooxygenase small subunit
MNADKQISELVYRSCLMLDALDFEGYLGLCAPEFVYRIVAYSPELKKDMVWQEVNKEELKHHLDLVPRHVRDTGTVARFPTVYSISYSEDGKRATALSGMQVYKTKRDGGETTLFGVCRLNDVIELNGGEPKLLSREVRMETRQLGIGSQIPV